MRQTRFDTRKPRAQGVARPTTLDRIMGDPVGLCSACLHAADCTYPRAAGQIVRHCGEFEGETRPAAAVPSRPPSLGTVETAVRTAPLGLCSNCASRDVCRYPHAEGGVWQCDEYR